MVSHPREGAHKAHRRRSGPPNNYRRSEAEALTDKLKAAMVERGTEALQGDGWKATWKNVVSSRFDSKRFKADHADLYGQYSKQTTTTRFCVGV